MNKIPKIIHYCWFGRGQKTEIVLKCIESWKKYLPDYEIKEWNEDNFDININTYVKQAYEAKKYAFVSDYVRLYALYNEGGIYMDTDVEVIKPLDVFLDHDAFTGYERAGLIPTGIIGAKPKHNWIEKNLRFYDNKKFIKEDGTYDLTTNVKYITSISKEMGFTGGSDFQIFGEGVAIYPFDYFCAKDHFTGKVIITNNTYTIHHFAGSWHSKSMKIKKFIRRMVGEEIFKILIKIKKVLKK